MSETWPDRPFRCPTCDSAFPELVSPGGCDDRWHEPEPSTVDQWRSEVARSAGILAQFEYAKNPIDAASRLAADMRRELDAAQPAPSVPAGADVAAVLAQLVAMHFNTDGVIRHSSFEHVRVEALWEHARQVVEAQAATGARAAGREKIPGHDVCPIDGEPLWLRIQSRGKPQLYVHADHLTWHTDATEKIRAATWDAPSSKLLPSAPSSAATDEEIERATRAAHRSFFGEYPVRGWDEIDDEHRESWFAVARAVLAAAPPTPSAPGVAELLAEARRRQSYGPFKLNASISCAEIVRLLSPGGADGTEAGT